MTTTLLLDSDIIAYRFASSCQDDYDWGEGITSRFTDQESAEDGIRRHIDKLVDTLSADSVVVCLTDAKNWRKEILPTYKANRDPNSRPELLAPLKEFMAKNYPTYIRPGLEADDVMGILSTSDKIIPGRKIIVSQDKDMKSVPGWMFNPDKDMEPWLVSREEADRWHLYQTLVGDSTDNYKGAPQIGDKAAVEFFDSPWMYRAEEYRVTRGKNKGEVRVKWHKEPTDDLWAGIVSLFARYGQTEEDALVQARVARICRKEDYDFKKKEVRLWSPRSL